VEYPVIVEQRNGVWRAVIPALSDLSAEGASRDEAMENAQRRLKTICQRWRSRQSKFCCREKKLCALAALRRC